MKMEVSATRMELLMLKKRIALAKRGHKLLKDKQDELITILLDLIKLLREIRKNVEEELQSAIARFFFARSVMEPEEVEEAFLLPEKEFLIEVAKARLFNIQVPKFEKIIKGKIHCYGFATTSCELDLALLGIEKVLSAIVDLAEKEKALQLVAIEVEKTRRRVNALEHVLIPTLEETTKYISMKLSEIERSDISRLMRIKEVIRK